MDRKKIYKKLEKSAIERYQTRFYKEGESYKSLGWGCTEDQIKRFEVLVQNIDFNNRTVMDIGCGFSDFYGYLKRQGISCNYIGVDIIPEFLECCRKKYSEATFIQANIMLEKDILPEVDIVVTTGTLNLKFQDIDNMEYTKNFISNAFEKAKELMSLDFLSTRLTDSYPKEDFVYYHDPVKVLEYCFKLTDNVKLIHNYEPIPQREGTMILYKGEKN